MFYKKNENTFISMKIIYYPDVCNLKVSFYFRKNQKIYLETNGKFHDFLDQNRKSLDFLQLTRFVLFYH